MAPPRRHLREGGADSSSEAGSDSSSDEIDTTAPASAPARAAPTMNVTEAAGLGSDHAACILGNGFFRGASGLPKDPARARYWLKKIVDDECEYKHFNNKWMAKSAEMLRELDA